jgi:uncharacterized membrane protein
MTAVDSVQQLENVVGARERQHVSAGGWGEPSPPTAERSRVNVGSAERAVSLASGAILAGFGIARRSVAGTLIAGVGGALVYRAVTGYCPAYSALGLSTVTPQTEPEQRAELAARGVHVEEAFLINRSPEELYGFWRDFSHLPRIMTHLEHVAVLDDRRSHWVARAHHVPGGRVEWDAEITRDEPNALIAWRSLPGADVDSVGQIGFARARGDRGTEVHVWMDYLPPAGRLGHWVATLFGQSPQRQVREDLRNFKRLMETGELPTIAEQPRGACTGTGRREPA